MPMTRERLSLLFELLLFALFSAGSVAMTGLALKALRGNEYSAVLVTLAIPCFIFGHALSARAHLLQNAFEKRPLARWRRVMHSALLLLFLNYVASAILLFSR